MKKFEKIYGQDLDFWFLFKDLFLISLKFLNLLLKVKIPFTEKRIISFIKNGNICNGQFNFLLKNFKVRLETNNLKLF